jgi:hypothetical protein
MLPFTVILEDDPFRDAPYIFAPPPPVTFPLITRRPVDVEALVAPAPLVPVVTFPVIFNVPEARFTAPIEFVPVPPLALPNTKKEPELELDAANEFVFEPPVQLPTIVADAGDSLEKVTVLVNDPLPPTTLALKETPLASTKDPPERIFGANVEFLIVSTFVEELAVIVKVLE